MIKRALFLSGLFSFFYSIVFSQTFPAGFSTTNIGSGWVSPVGATFTPDGQKLFVWEKSGHVFVCNRNSSGTYIKQTTPVLDIEEEVGNWRDFGLLGFALDPNFATNGYIYLMYVVDRHHLLYYGTPNYNPAADEYYNATIGRITRYQTSVVSGNLIANPASRTILLGETKQTGIPILYESHGTGSLVFAPDGSLLASAGDGASYISADGGNASETYYAQALTDGIIRSEENVGAFRSQMLNSLNGKILRINPANGNGIPSNPFYDASAPRSAKSRVWALGFRNPFRFTIKPGTGSTNQSAGDIGEIYVGDVGYNTWEELDIINAAGVNCGWPLYEGLTQVDDYLNLSTLNLDEPNPLYNGGSCNTPYFKFKNLLKQATADNIKTVYNPCNNAVPIGTGNRYFHLRPSLDWFHSSNISRVGVFNGNNADIAFVGTAQSGVIGSPFLGNASVAGCWYTGNAYPTIYRNTFFQADYGGGWLKSFTVDFVDQVQKIQDFANGFGAIVCVTQNPLDGTLVYVDVWNSLVKNINYGGNQVPVVVMSSDKTYGPSPLNVSFNSNSSYDPDGTITSRSWDFGDGSPTSNSINPIHNFTAPSNTPTKYVVKLTITDNSGGTSIDSIIVSVNNTPPVVHITSPIKNSFYTLGSDTTYTCSATVTDAEQAPGQLKYSWQTILRHNSHQHAEPIDTNKTTSSTISRIGCNGETYYWEFLLKVTDAAGLSASDTSFIYPTVIPSISINVNPGNTICSGTQVTFSATPINGGSAPSYQWKRNGNNVGSNSNQYQSAGLANGDIITCVLTSNAECANPSVITSNAITMTVSASVTPTVSIAANTGSAICSGTQVTFTATPINGGSTPSYQWKLNGNNVGINSNIYQNIALVNGDIVTCVMTSNFNCATPITVTSNAIAMSVTAPVTPSISILASPGNTICSGTQVTFNATSTNGGSPPSYQWKLNGNNVGTNNSQYQNSGLANGDIVTCVITSSANCATPSIVTSNAITMSVTVSVTPSISIGASPGNAICSGTQVTFTASPTNSGLTPSFQWKLNGNNVGNHSNQYQNSGLITGDIVTCVLTSNATCASPAIVTSNPITMSTTASVAPSVIIVANPGSSICAGTQVTFTATPTNGGAIPLYQWKLNGNNVGTNSNQYQNSSLANGDVVTCVMTSTLACANPISTTSNSLSMTITASVVPFVSIAANPGNSTCASTLVTFTATPANGGNTPSYQWKLNGSNVGANSSQYQNSNLANGDIVSCVMTSSASCASPVTAVSNSIAMTITALVTPSLSITATPGNAICAGTQVTFTATPTNGGSTPSYQWKVNGNNVGTNSNQYQNIGFANGDIVTCVMTSNANCASTTTVTSNPITMAVTALVTPAISITANPGTTICAGSLVTFNAISTNGGSLPFYQWRVNGNNVGINSNQYQSTSLSNGDIVTCILISNANCISSPTALSNAITMTVNPIPVPSISIAANPGNNICAGSPVTFTATPTNGGSSSYQWKLNGNNVGTNSNQYQNSGLVNGNIITCMLTSNATCAAPTSVTSNIITVTVTTPVSPLVSISVNPNNTICAGTLVTFIATPTNGGLAPSYQWKLNGDNVGSGSNQYQRQNFVTGDIISCEMTSSLTCAAPPISTSNGITMNVIVPVSPSINITADPGNIICSGTSVTFNATSTSDGSTPTYQWKLNGNNVGTNSNQYQNPDLANGDIMTCVLTSTANCAGLTSVISNPIAMAISASVTPSVNITANTGNAICTGTQVTFTASSTNGGNAPIYQWKLNGNNVGNNSYQYITAAINNNDIVTCTLTSNSDCASPTTVESNALAMTVNSTLTPSISIVANPGNIICSKETASFTAIPINGGLNPIYQWKLNGNNVGTNSNQYQNTNLVNGDIITCTLISNAPCVSSPPTAVSNAITMVVNAIQIPSVSISADPGNSICAGTSVNFIATPINGGLNPIYQWKLNGNNVGNNSNQYLNTNLTNGDLITCILTSNAVCVNPSSVGSNTISMTVNSISTPSVSIIADPGNAICSGTSVTFKANPTNGGSTPQYQWKLNGNDVGTNSNQYQNTNLTNGDIVICAMTSSMTCTNSTSVLSNQIAITINGSPSIASQPVSQSAIAGSSVNFTVVASGSGLTYQWRKEGLNIQSATTSTYSIAHVGIENAGDYDVVISGNCQPSITSNMAILTVSAITTQPINQNTCTGDDASFTIVATGSSLNYQWQVSANGGQFTNIAGANSPVLKLTGVTSSMNGNQYHCIINGSLVSNPAILKVNPLPIVSLTLPFDTLYQNSAVQTLSGGTPSGGVYTGSGVSGGKFNPIANQQGKYPVSYKYTDVNGCSAEANDEFAVIAQDIGVNIYPNPSMNGALTIVISPDLVGSTVTAFNSFGQVVSSWNIGGRLTNYHLGWPAGIYMLHFKQGTKTVSKRFVIIR